MLRVLCNAWKGKRLALALLILGLAAATPPASSRAAEGEEDAPAEEGPMVERIIIRGSLVFPEDEIKFRMSTREGRPLDRAALRQDYDNLRKIPEFEDVQVKEERTPGGGVNIIILVREKMVIKRVVFKGNRQVRSRSLRDLVKSKAGDRFDRAQAAEDARAIEDWYKGEFYYFAEVEAVPEPFEDGVRLVYDINEGGRLSVRQIYFRGNFSYRDKILLKYMQTKPTSIFTRGLYRRRTFEDDLNRLKLFYQSNGYLDVEIIERPFQITDNTPTSRFQRRDAYIYIDIDEGEQYRVGTVTFRGNQLVTDGDLRGVVTTAPGMPFSPMQIQDDARTIRDEYGRYPSSRYFTQVRADYGVADPDLVSNTVDVVFDIAEGPEVEISDVQIVGLTKTKQNVVRRELPFYPGDKIDSRALIAAERNLRNLDFFKGETLAIDVKQDGGPDAGRIVVNVEDKPTGKITFGLGISSTETFIATISLSQRNFDFTDWPENLKQFVTGQAFVGAGQHFNASASFGTRSRNYSVDFMNPWIFNRPIRWGAGTYFNTYEWDLYTTETFGLYTTVGRRLFHPLIDGSVTYKWERISLRKVDGGASQTIKDEDGYTNIGRYIFDVNWDSRDNRFDPQQGLHVDTNFMLAGGVALGDSDFWRWSNSATYYHRLYTLKNGGNFVLASGSEFTTMDTWGDTEQIPLYEKLYAGGIGTVRGYAHQSLGPRNDDDPIGGKTRQTNSVELFAPVYQNTIKISGFFDYGGVWEDRFDIGSGEKSGETGGEGYRASAGAGLHVRTPLSPMPIRVYWTHAFAPKDGDETETIQFTFGAIF